MIFREILANPSIPFDYFNDFDDTMKWLRWLKDPRRDAAIESLNAGRASWYAEWRRKMDAAFPVGPLYASVPPLWRNCGNSAEC